jgi:hypothetical protein
VRPQLVIAPCEPFEPLVVERVDDRYVVELQSELRDPPPHGVDVAEQREFAHLAPSDPVGGTQDSIVGAFGQDDVRACRLRALDQFVLEHDRRHDVGSADLDPPLEALQIDVRLEMPEGDVDLASVTGGDRSGDGIRGDRRVERVGVDRHQGDRPPARHPPIMATTLGSGRMPPVTSTPETLGQADEDLVIAAATITSARSPGVMKTVSSRTWSSTFGTDMAATFQVADRAGEVVRIAGDEFCAEGRAELFERWLT